MKKLLLILIVTLFAGAANAQQYPFTYEYKEISGMHYVYFYKKSSISDKRLVVHYRIHFYSDRSSQSRMATILASGSQDRSTGYNEKFYIQVTNYEVTGDDSLSSPQSSSSSSSSESSPSATEQLRDKHQATVGTVSSTDVVWAEMNVGANYIEDYGTFYTFKQAQKACPEGWRLPTIAEYQSLFDLGSEWTTQEGVLGRRFNTGRQTIFLPAAGFRGVAKSSGKLISYKGHIFGGYYWAAGRGAGSKGEGFQFKKDGTWTVAPPATNEYQVRCVRK